jgi:hypothetical protein
MAKKLQLTIAEPCHENWDAMTPVEKGKFCGACQKQVVDFSHMSDRQVAEFFKKPSTGSVCGRFMTDQLVRPIDIPRKRIPWLKYFFQIAIPAFLVTLKASASRTQGEIKLQTVTDTTKPIRKKLGMLSRPIKQAVITKDSFLPMTVDPKILTDGEPPNIIVGGLGVEMIASAEFNFDKKEILGKVVDHEGKPVPFASIVFTDKGGVMADEHGTFRLARTMAAKYGSIIVSAVGFESKAIAVRKDMKGPLTVELKSNVVLSEVIVTSMVTIKGYVTGYTVSSICKITKINKKDSLTNDMIKHPITANQLLVYPNPVATGSSININLKNAEEGYYVLQLLSQSGQMIRQQEIWIDAEAGLMNTTIPAVAAGTYLVVLTNKKTGRKYSEKIIIQ